MQGNYRDLVLSEAAESALYRSQEPVQRVARSNRPLHTTNVMSPALGLLGPNKKRTIPSIPYLSEEVHTLGPWSYTPNHNLVSQSVKNSVRMV